MPLADALVYLAPVLANLILGKYLSGSSATKDLAVNLTASGISGFFDIAANRLGDKRKQDKVKDRFKTISNEVVDSIEVWVTKEMPELTEEDKAVTLYAVAGCLNEGQIDAKVLAEWNLQGDRLYKELVKNKSRHIIGLNDAQIAFFDRAMHDISEKVVSIASQFPQFSERVLGEILSRTDSLDKVVQDTLKKVNALYEQAEKNNPDTARRNFEITYRNFINNKEGLLSIFGLDVDEQIRQIGLKTAVIPLRAARVKKLVRDDVREKNLDASDVLEQSNRVVIIGGPGSGKTTLLQWFAVSATESGHVDAPSSIQNKVPFLIRLRSFSGKALPAKGDWMKYLMEHKADDLPAGWMDVALDSPRGLVMIDGIDELPKKQHKDVRRWIDILLLNYPNIKLVLTSRDPAVQNAEWQSWFDTNGFDQIRLEELTDDQIQLLIDNWHEAVRQKDSASEAHDKHVQSMKTKLENALEKDAATRRMATTPLLCAMLCALNYKKRGELPSQRIELYKETCDMLLRKRDNARDIATEEANLDLRQAKNILCGLAIWMLRNSKTEIAASGLKRHIKENSGAGKGITNEQIFRLLTERSGVIRLAAVDKVDFVHRTFLEYFAAEALKDEAGWDEIVTHAHDVDWAETIVLASALADKPGRKTIIEGLIKKGYESPGLIERHRLFLLAAWCGASAAKLEKTTLEQMEQALEQTPLPYDEATVKNWANAGYLALPRLAFAAPKRAWQRAYCVNALALMGSEKAFEQIKCYAQSIQKNDWRLMRAVGDAWRWFDRKVYFEQILAKQKNLRFLDWIGLNEFKILAAAPQLQSVDLRNTKVTDEGLKALAAAPQLQSVDLSSTQVTDEGVKALAAAPQLQSVYLRDTQVTDEGVKALAAAPQLQSVDLRNTKVTDEGVKALAAAPQLQSVDLRNTKVTDEGVKALAAAPQLQSVDLSSTQVTDEGVKALAAAPQLQSVYLWNTKVTDEGVKALAAAPQLQSIYLWNTKVTDEGVKALAAAPQLQSVDLMDTKVTDEGVKALATAPQLQSIYLWNTKVTDEGVKALASAPQLQSVSLMDTKVTDEGVKALASAPQLQSVSLMDTKVTDEGVKALAAAPQLQSVYLRDTKVTDEGVKALAAAPQLQSVYLRDTKVTDEGVKALAAAPQLQSVDLRDTKVTDEIKEFVKLSGIEIYLFW